MKVLFLPLLCLALLSFNQPKTEKKAKKVSFSGTLTETNDYCGGARPSDEILTQLGTPRPLANKKIYIKKGEVNTFDNKVILVLTSDSKGNFHAKLRPGKYLVVDSTKKDPAYYNQLLKTYKNQTANYLAIDSLCLKEWYVKPTGVFEVSATEKKSITVNFHKACSEAIPCTRYTGPFRQ